MARKSKSKKKRKTPKYNRDSVIINNLKRSFSRSPVVKEVMNDVRSEEVWYKKDGTPASKPRVLFECAECKERHMGKNVQCDHIEPVIPLNIPAKHMMLGVVCFRLFVKKDKLQVLCKPCHKLKSKEENRIRREWRKKEKYIVYITENMINHKSYIGVHKCVDLDDGYLGSGTAFLKAVKKYGKENFERRILFVYDNAKEAYEKEGELVWEWVVECDSYYNLTNGGKYLKMTNDIKDKISKAKMGKNTGEDNYMYGKTHSEEVRKKIGDREYSTGKDHAAARSVKCVETGEIYSSATEAGTILGKNGASIGRVCRGERKTAYGYKWEFVDET